ncbi:hypothetical protein RSAG8_02696, partial [Rhizoctonia solani AG-8 WAC10335]
MRHKPTDATPGNGTARAHSLTEQVSSMSLATHDPDYISPLEAMQPANEETLQVHYQDPNQLAAKENLRRLLDGSSQIDADINYQDPNQLAAKENLRRLLDGSSQIDADIINVDTPTEPEESQNHIPVEPKRKRGGPGGTRKSQRKR